MDILIPILFFWQKTKKKKDTWKQLKKKKQCGSIYLIASQRIGQRWDLKAFVHKDVEISGKIRGLSHCPPPTPLVKSEWSTSLTRTFHSSHQQGMHSATTNREGTQPYLVILGEPESCHRRLTNINGLSYSLRATYLCLGLVCTYYNYQ